MNEKRREGEEAIMNENMGGETGGINGRERERQIEKEKVKID